MINDEQQLLEALHRREEVALREHLATCHNCRVVLDTTQQTIFLYREQGKRVIPAERRGRLFAQLQQAFLAHDRGAPCANS